ncbi:unnamed protein product, partial [Sphagnum jensenii]
PVFLVLYHKQFYQSFSDHAKDTVSSRMIRSITIEQAFALDIFFSMLPRAYTHLASILLFIYFGIKLLKDAMEMRSDGPSDELHEVEEELINKKNSENVHVDVVTTGVLPANTSPSSTSISNS